jgi:broad specificity phosphatase PhoE
MTQPAPPAGRSPAIFDRAFLTGRDDVTLLILVRHGEQFVPNYLSGPVSDTIDPPLSERGERQAELVGLRFSTDNIDAVYASPLRRALETGRQIARHHRLEPRVVGDLREVEIFRDIPPEKAGVVVACHGGVINAYIGHIIRSPYDMFFRPAHTSVSVVAAAEGFRAVHSLNDVHHLFHGEESWVSH